MKTVALLIALGVAGCTNATFGAGASSGHPPPLPPGTNIPKWDHFCGAVAGTDGLTRLLDEASANGWEMVSEAGGVVCFKRPHPSQPIAPAPAGA